MTLREMGAEFAQAFPQVDIDLKEALNVEDPVKLLGRPIDLFY